MAWMLADADATPAAWATRTANLKAHAENLTAVSPCIYDIGADGTFAKGTGPRPYAQLYPHMKDMQAMGLQVIPLIAGPPNLAGQRALTSDNGARFIKEAVAEAVADVAEEHAAERPHHEGAREDGEGLQQLRRRVALREECGGDLVGEHAV